MESGRFTLGGRVAFGVGGRGTDTPSGTEVIRDPEALQAAALAIYDGSLLPGPLAGCMADLGVSSLQLDKDERGFSFRTDGPLDMRMDSSASMSAQRFLAEADEKDLANVIWRLGEEPMSRPIARAIVRAREAGELTSTLDLAEAIRGVVPQKYPKKKGGLRGKPIDPATKTFQAIRMAVNGELEDLEGFLLRAPFQLALGGPSGSSRSILWKTVW